MFGPNHILETMRWDGGRSPSHENVCRKTKKLCASLKIYEMERTFSKFVKNIVSKCLRANKMVGYSV